MTQPHTFEIPTTLCDEDGNVTGETVFTLDPPHCKGIKQARTEHERTMDAMRAERDQLGRELAWWKAQQ